jgi:hypothetical protein
MSGHLDDHEAPGLEIIMRQTMDRAKETLPPDVGCAVFCFHYGEGKPGDYLAYGSTTSRETMIEVIVEWLARQASLGHNRTLEKALVKHFNVSTKG